MYSLSFWGINVAVSNYSVTGGVFITRLLGLVRGILSLYYNYMTCLNQMYIMQKK